jgi:hypothetical protein
MFFDIGESPLGRQTAVLYHKIKKIARGFPFFMKKYFLRQLTPPIRAKKRSAAVALLLLF